MMPALALTIALLWLVLAMGLRVWLHWRRTGSSGFHGLSGKPGSAEWWGGVLFVAALVLLLAAPVLALIDVVPVPSALDHPAVGGAGLVLALAGLAGTLVAQAAMGSSWRIGVEQTERTALVTSGLFRWVRNPVFTAMIAACLGLALMVPTWVAALALLALIAAVELQVRTVEEPYLVRVHGPTYRAYAARTGRFVPGVGRRAAADPAGTRRRPPPIQFHRWRSPGDS